MKKTTSLLMAFAMTAALLTGCSGNSTTATESQTTTETTAAETTAVPEPADETDAQAPTMSGTDATITLEGPGEADSVTLRIGSLKGPTSMGLVSLMDKAENGTANGNYEFTMVTDASELVAQMVGGNLDIALVPANMASILYQRTNQGVSVIDINTLGVLYIVAADDSIQRIADVAGKTVYMTGKGTTPDYVFQYLLSANGLTTDDVAIEYKSEATEVAATLKEQPEVIGLLPQPFVTVAMAQNENLKMVLDLTAEWDKVQAEEKSGSLVTGVTIVRNELLADEASVNAIQLFMDEHAQSADFANNNMEETAQLVAAAEIIAQAPVAQKAIPYCSIVCIEGEEMKTMLSGYLNVLFAQDPTSVGGQLPDDAFYYAR